MKSFLKLVLTTMVLVTAIMPLSAGSPATNHPAAAMSTTGKTRYYYVYYRYSPHYGWAYYGAYRTLADAQYVARALQYWYGVETFVR